MEFLQIFFYASMLIFIVGTAYKAVKIARMPLHLRWDLYPIPHEKGKADYGGSYYEEINWWTKPANVSMPSEVKEMGKEIFFIQSMYHNNRPLWIFSFPFHFGLYLTIGYLLLLYLGVILERSGVPVTADAGVVGQIVYYLTVPFGLVGAVLGLFGAIGLFFSRIFKYELRAPSVWSDYFNLLLLGGIFLTTLWTWAAVDGTLGVSREFIGSMITFSTPQAVPAVAYLNFFLASAFLLWLPFTHMTHFVGKYFTYHKVRWEDHPNIRGSALEKSVQEALGYTITWAAPHIKSGGTWAEAATATGEEEGRKK